MSPRGTEPTTGGLRLGFVTGATPDKWAATWRSLHPGEVLELVPLTEADQEDRVRDGSVDLAIVRLPLDREDLHVVVLYVERPVVVAARDHVVAAYDEVPAADLAHEQFALPPPPGLTPQAAQLAFPPMDPREAIEVAASGAAVVVLPMSVARLHHRKDVVHRPVTGLDGTSVALAWLQDRDGPRIQEFVGIARGRTIRSSRG